MTPKHPSKTQLSRLIIFIATFVGLLLFIIGIIVFFGNFPGDDSSANPTISVSQPAKEDKEPDEEIKEEAKINSGFDNSSPKYLSESNIS